MSMLDLHVQHFMVVLLLGQHTQQSICVLMCMQQFLIGWCWTIQAQECMNGTMLCNVKTGEATSLLVADDDCGHATGMSCKHTVS